MATFDDLKSIAKQWLQSGEVKLVIGYGAGSTSQRRRASFVRTADEAGALVLDGLCEENLAHYLVREGLLQDGKKVAIFLQPAGIRSINVLAAEDQINPDQVLIFGFEIKNPGQAGSEVSILDGRHVKDFGERIQQVKSAVPASAAVERSELIAKLEAMSAQERFSFWKNEFSKCVKCYACRQSCPMCYCRRCIVDRNQPQWVCTSSHTLGNFEWNIVRAFHLAGRCVGCGNCQRACPAGIPLMLLNQRMAMEVLQQFDHFAGESADQPPVLASFRKEDPDTFIL